MPLNIKRTNQRSTYLINRDNRNHERFETLPHPQTLFTQWSAYAQGQFHFIRTQPTIRTKPPRKEWNRYEYEIDLLEVFAKHMADKNSAAAYL